MKINKNVVRLSLPALMAALLVGCGSDSSPSPSVQSKVDIQPTMQRDTGGFVGDTFTAVLTQGQYDLNQSVWISNGQQVHVGSSYTSNNNDWGNQLQVCTPAGYCSQSLELFSQTPLTHNGDIIIL